MLFDTCLPEPVTGSDNVWVDARPACCLQKEAQLLQGVAGLQTLCAPEEEVLN